MDALLQRASEAGVFDGGPVPRSMREARLRGLGIAGVVLGAGALGVGLWRLLDQDDEPSAWRIEIAPTRGGAAVQLGVAF